jgi:hypothetical protein
LITHNDALQSVGLLWTSYQLVVETPTWQHTTYTTNIQGPDGLRTHDRSRRAAVDLLLRPRGHWDRHLKLVSTLNPGPPSQKQHSTRWLFPPEKWT